MSNVVVLITRLVWLTIGGIVAFAGGLGAGGTVLLSTGNFSGGFCEGTDCDRVGGGTHDDWDRLDYTEVEIVVLDGAGLI